MSTESQNISIWGHKFTKEEFDKLVEMHRTPTWEEVVKAWERMNAKKYDYDFELISVEYDSSILGERIVINFKWFGEQTRDIIEKEVLITDFNQGNDLIKLNAINLTIRYLEAQNIMIYKK
ncbi:hypothetical protein G7061_04145 [Erysipelothrix sp. HDW6B]|uniref:hypothetical protein n=1 Tax=Erysipelothrix sp. HDW6B TaxID=2714929 RepID=UPI00140C00F8|nr:hypothetical protein [Erysipelothrix sp. HDW6B]QIK85846.1 hypothetical protein G7061_04145 [Erysipelothrix sp. HDW6B]